MVEISPKITEHRYEDKRANKSIAMEFSLKFAKHIGKQKNPSCGNHDDPKNPGNNDDF